MQYRSELGAQTTPHSDLYCKESLYYFDFLQPLLYNVYPYSLVHYTVSTPGFT